MSEWKQYRIDDIKDPVPGSIAIGPFGSRMKSDCYVASGVPVIRGNNISDGKEFTDDFVYITEETASTLGNAIVYADDLVFPHRGSIGQVGIVRNGKFEKYALSSSLMKLSCDKSKADPMYVFYFFRSSSGRHALLQNASTVGTPGIGQPLSSLKSIEISLPPLPEQKRIAKILGDLDDKIELNRQMNATLEGMARALFQSWFIDFDPVRAKAEGRVPVGMDAETAKLFPSEFVESELGMIPKGWEVKSVGDVVECVGGSTPSTAEPAYWEGGTHPWTTPKDFSSLQSPILIDTDRRITDAGLAKVSSGLLPAGTLLMSSRAPVGYLAISAIPVAINQGFIALKCNSQATAPYMLNWCQSNMDEIKSRASGTTFPEISKTNFRPIKMVVPTEAVIRVFTSSVFYSKIVDNEKSIRTLSECRQLLLLNLINRP